MVRQGAEDLVALLTPVVRGAVPPISASRKREPRRAGLPGGHGYIRESGVEHVRDARIAMIYEGTNGIQALDLVGASCRRTMGRYLRAFFHPVSRFIEDHASAEALAPMVSALAQAAGALQLATGMIAERG